MGDNIYPSLTHKGKNSTEVVPIVAYRVEANTLVRTNAIRNNHIINPGRELRHYEHNLPFILCRVSWQIQYLTTLLCVFLIFSIHIAEGTFPFFVPKKFPLIVICSFTEPEHGSLRYRSIRIERPFKWLFNPLHVHVPLLNVEPHGHSPWHPTSRPSGATSRPNAGAFIHGQSPWPSAAGVNSPYFSS